MLHWFGVCNEIMNHTADYLLKLQLHSRLVLHTLCQQSGVKVSISSEEFL